MNDEVGTLIEPQPVAFTFGAPGWYVVGATVVAVMLTIVILFYRHYSRNRYRRSAVSWLERREVELYPHYPTSLVYDAVFLMKRIAITRYGRISVAAMRDKAWFDFLNQSCRLQLFEEQDAAWLHNVLYSPKHQLAETEIRQFIAKTKKWILKHRYAI